MNQTNQTTKRTKRHRKNQKADRMHHLTSPQHSSHTEFFCSIFMFRLWRQENEVNSSMKSTRRSLDWSMCKNFAFARLRFYFKISQSSSPIYFSSEQGVKLPSPPLQKREKFSNPCPPPSQANALTQKSEFLFSQCSFYYFSSSPLLHQYWLPNNCL